MLIYRIRSRAIFRVWARSTPSCLRRRRGRSRRIICGIRRRKRMANLWEMGRQIRSRRNHRRRRRRKTNNRNQKKKLNKKSHKSQELKSKLPWDSTKELRTWTSTRLAWATTSLILSSQTPVIAPPRRSLTKMRIKKTNRAKTKKEMRHRIRKSRRSPGKNRTQILLVLYLNKIKMMMMKSPNSRQYHKSLSCKGCKTIPGSALTSTRHWTGDPGLVTRPQCGTRAQRCRMMDRIPSWCTSSRWRRGNQSRRIRISRLISNP